MSEIEKRGIIKTIEVTREGYSLVRVVFNGESSPKEITVNHRAAYCFAEPASRGIDDLKKVRDTGAIFHFDSEGEVTRMRLATDPCFQP